MLRTSRLHCLLLALLLAGNALVLAGHFNVHGKASVEQCLLCASQVNPHSAVPVSAQWLADLYQQPVNDEPPVAAQVHHVSLTRPHPRGPPAAA